MSKGTITNMRASVLARLKNLSKLRRLDYQHILLRYATERFLYRLSISGYADNFVLKGGNLFVIWQNGDNSRPTMDSDLLCFGDTSHEYLRKVFASIAGMEDSDGIMFDAEGITVEAIREDTKYGGARVTFNAFIGTVRIPLQFDIGVGDAITPVPEQANYPVLLDGSPPHIKIYPMATVIAEKLEAMVVRGGSNSRMKDFYDIWQLSRLAEHSARTLRTAIENTFQRRGTEFPWELPYALTTEFAQRPEKPVQWHAFCRKNHLADASPAFLGPCLKYEHDRNMVWSPDNGWKNADE